MTRALLILGAGVRPGGQPGPSLQRRVNKAIALWHGGGFDMILASGGVGLNPPAEAEVMRQLLLAAGVPDGAILRETRSTSTFTNAAFSRALLDRHAISDVTIVTDGFHGPRSYLTFRRFGIDARVVSAADAPPRPPRSVTLRSWMREGAALPVYLLGLYLRRLPDHPSDPPPQ